MSILPSLVYLQYLAGFSPLQWGINRCVLREMMILLFNDDLTV